MLKKHLILLGILISMVLLMLATWYYPGGSPFDKTTIGYDWKRNYISNLFAEKAFNGAVNEGRFWGVAGMVFFSASLAWFFIGFSEKIPIKGAAKVIKYIGAAAMFFTFLIATPLHDVMVVISSTLFLIGMFYITVFVLKSKLHVLKLCCVFCLLVFYSTLYLYGADDFREFLPILQKATFAIVIVVVIGLVYFTKKEDFAHMDPKTKREQKPEHTA